jgi:hypothetical protein
MHGLGLHLGAWMAGDGDATDYLSPSFCTEIGRAAEAAKLHALFRAEQITVLTQPDTPHASPVRELLDVLVPTAGPIRDEQRTDLPASSFTFG